MTVLKEADPKNPGSVTVGSVEGIAALANALRVNCTLVRLVLAKNGLGDVGIREVCDALQSNSLTNLAYLNVSSNDVNAVPRASKVRSMAAQSLAAMVAATSSLTALDAQYNDDLGRDGKALVKQAAEERSRSDRTFALLEI